MLFGCRPMRTWRTTSASRVEADRSIDEVDAGARAGQVDEDARRDRDALVVKRDLAVEFDDDAHGIGQHRSPDVFDRGERALVGSSRRRASAARGTPVRRRPRRRSICVGFGSAAGADLSSARAAPGPARASLLVGYICGQQAEQANAGRPVPWLDETRERVEREAAGLPQRVVAVAARRIVAHDAS